VSEVFEDLLAEHKRVTILAHYYPDGDSIATALGIYALLKNVGKQVEVCCVGELLPKSLDFLPHFAKIKRQSDFGDSLIMACDSSTIELFGFDLSSRKVIRLDTTQVAYELLKQAFEINKTVALCFYVALLRETDNFKTADVNQHLFMFAAELLSYGIDLAAINRNMNQRKALSSLRVLRGTLDTLELYHEAEVASLFVSQALLEQSGADRIGLAEMLEHAIDLATVQIAILVIEEVDSLEVIIQSKEKDLSSLAMAFGGKGDGSLVGFTSKKIEVQKLFNKILNEINNRGLLDG